MKVFETGFNGLYILEPTVFKDSRGYFMESFNAKILPELGLNTNFIQDNQSFSTRGVLRGLHFQNVPYAQTKLVRVLSGVVMDVVVDLRKNEPTFGKNFSIELSEANRKQLFIPKGFAHGFLVLSNAAEVLYKCDNYYHPEAEGGLLFNDPVLEIDWGVPTDQVILSDKDLMNPVLANANFRF